MLVSHRRRFIYTKTYKTGGTSVEVYFEPYCLPDGEWTPADERAESVSEAGIIGFRGRGRPAGCRWWNHMAAALIRAQVGEEVWQSYFKFCVVRNPYDKVISAFYFQRARRLFSMNPAETDAEQFERWLLSAKIPPDRNKYLIDGRMCLDFIVRHENMPADLEHVCRRLGIAWEPARLPNFKAGFRPATATRRALFSPAAQEFVQRTFAFELETFGYS